MSQHVINDQQYTKTMEEIQKKDRIESAFMNKIIDKLLCNDAYLLRKALANEESVRTALSRIDTLTQLPNGSTTGDAELADIRVGADGTKYPNAGDAVREQIKNVAEAAEEANALLREDLIELDTDITYEYLKIIPISVSVGCFSKVGWNFYIDSWATGYNYTRLSVENRQKYVISGYGNANAQAIMFFSGEPSQDTYISGLGDDEQTYINYEIEVPANATVMLVQTMPHKAIISVSKKVRYTLPKAIYGKMYWEIKDGELTVVSKYTSETDLVVKFGKRGCNNLPDFKSFATCKNTSKIPSSGVDATEFIGDVTDWHSPFQIRAVENADGDKGTNYNYTGGNHNYNNSSAIGDGLATARCSNLTFLIDGVETTVGR